jgi:Deoxycytidylate deaminase
MINNKLYNINKIINSSEYKITNDFYYQQAKSCSNNSNCLKVKYGSVIALFEFNKLTNKYDSRIIANGFNFGRCSKQCNKILNNEAGGSYEYCTSIHSEVNALLAISSNDKDKILNNDSISILYLYGNPLIKKYDNFIAEPCNYCKNIMINSKLIDAVVTFDRKAYKYINYDYFEVK